MAAHHPSHHSPPPESSNKSKKWRHYFYEFFMLFLAISLGFYVDNLREHYLENKREKQYMRMLLEDLRTDIHVLDSNITFRQTREDKLQKLISLMGEKDLQKNASLIYYLLDSTDGYETFTRDDRTIQQLKGAGGMRMIRNDKVTAAIIDYDGYLVTEIDWNNRTEANRIDNYKQSRFKLFNVQLLNRLINGDSAISFSFLPYTPASINEISGAIFQVMRISSTCRDNAKIAKAKAQYLMDVVRNEYHIKP